jgi:hypothetical protein
MKFFERHLFLEFFDTEKIIDAEVHISLFTVSLLDGFKFSLYISPHEEFVILELIDQQKNSSIFEIELNHLSHVTCDEQSLHFFRANNQPSSPYQDKNLQSPFWSIKIKPMVYFQLDV